VASRAAGTLVRADGVAKAYQEGGAEASVLRDVNLELSRGETASLVGVSGSGKSTLIALLAGLLLPDSGYVRFDGNDLTALDEAARARLRARRIGVVLQSGNLIPFLTAVENVELALELGGEPSPRQRATSLLTELGLGGRLHDPPRRLSGGEAQRVAVATALANDPDLLLADEVTGELDAHSAERVLGIVLEACHERGLAVLFVTHSKALAERADRQLLLSDGRVSAA
jgi:putative ABC transport system ATP-binding protein